MEANYKSGRCRSGSDTIGQVLHALPANSSWSYNPALCGAKPGPRGNGWGSWPKPVAEVNCKACLKKLRLVPEKAADIKAALAYLEKARALLIRAGVGGESIDALDVAIHHAAFQGANA